MNANVLSITLVVAMPCCWEDQGTAVEYCCDYGYRALYHCRYTHWCPIFVNIVSRGVIWIGSCAVCFHLKFPLREECHEHHIGCERSYCVDPCDIAVPQEIIGCCLATQLFLIYCTCPVRRLGRIHGHLIWRIDNIIITSCCMDECLYL